MFRGTLNRALRALLPAAVLAGAVAIPFDAGTARAAGPKLTLRCLHSGVPNHISCWTWGNNFAASEWVHFTYNVTFLTMPKVNGRRPSQTFKRTVKANGIGTLTRTPRISFVTSKVHSTYTVAVTGVGAQKDKGFTSLVSIGT